MPKADLESFKSNLLDLARPNRFMISITEENNNFGFNDDDWYFCKGCSIPGKTMGEIELNWQGHKYKLAGDPTFNDVTVTFWNNVEEDDMDMLRVKFEKWFHAISNDSDNLREIHTKYKCTVFIKQLNGQNQVIRTYKLINAHPKDLGEIELSMESTDAVEEYPVIFSYSYYEVDGRSGNDSGAGESAGNPDIAVPSGNFISDTAV
jgi:T4-like virus tail tube protein gp19